MKIVLAFVFLIFTITRNINGRFILENEIVNEIKGNNY